MAPASQSFLRGDVTCGAGARLGQGAGVLRPLRQRLLGWAGFCLYEMIDWGGLGLLCPGADGRRSCSPRRRGRASGDVPLPCSSGPAGGTAQLQPPPSTYHQPRGGYGAKCGWGEQGRALAVLQDECHCCKMQPPYYTELLKLKCI